MILPNSIKKLLKNLKLKTLSGALWLDQTLKNFHLMVVLRLLLNCYLYLRFGQWQLDSQERITIWGKNWTFCPYRTLKQQIMLISSVTWLLLLSSSSWAEVWVAEKSSSTSLANCGSTRAHNLCHDNCQLIVIAINRNRSAIKINCN